MLQCWLLAFRRKQKIKRFVKLENAKQLLPFEQEAKMKSSKCKQEQEQMLPLWQDIFKRKQFEEEVNIRRRTPQLPTTFNPCVNCTTQTSNIIIRLLSVHKLLQHFSTCRLKCERDTFAEIFCQPLHMCGFGTCWNS